MNTAEWLRFWTKVSFTDTCWLWMGTILKGGGHGGRGYGQFVVKTPKRRMAHVYAYEQLVGPVPEGMELDHLCKVRHCLNPAHLEAVSHRVNLLRGDTFQARNVAKTHCPQNHPYDEANTYHYQGERHCRICRHASTRARRAMA